MGSTEEMEFDSRQEQSRSLLPSVDADPRSQKYFYPVAKQEALAQVKATEKSQLQEAMA